MRLAWVTPFAALSVLGLALLGLAFLALPDMAMRVSDHDISRLPEVLGGRYLFLAMSLGGSLWLANDRMSALICAGFAMMSAIDTVLYASVPGIRLWPHVSALALSVLGVVLFLLRGRVSPSAP